MSAHTEEPGSCTSNFGDQGSRSTSHVRRTKKGPNAPGSLAGELAVLNMITAVMKAEMMRPANVFVPILVGKLRNFAKPSSSSSSKTETQKTDHARPMLLLPMVL